MNLLVEYFQNVSENTRNGKWQLLLFPVLFSIVGIYLGISTYNGVVIPFESIAVKNVAIPVVFFILGFLIPVAVWRRYIWRFSVNQNVLWNKDGFSFAFSLIIFSVFLQIFAIWGDASWDKVFTSTGEGNAKVIQNRQISLGGFVFQVGEVVKVFFMIFVAKMLTDMRINNQIRYCKEFFIFPVLAILPIAIMTALMPNYSMLIIYCLILFLMILFQKMEYKLRIPILLVFVVLPILIAIPVSKLNADNPLVEVHGVDRIWAFFQEDGTGNAQQNEALQAMAGGGVTGKGPDRGTIKLRLFGANNDFAFSILGEELGLWLMIPITLAMMGFLFACFWVAVKIEPNGNRSLILAQNLAYGIAIIFSLNIFLHIGVNLKLLPNTGQPLSFVSSGGANLAMNFFLMGMLVQISSLNRDE